MFKFLFSIFKKQVKKTSKFMKSPVKMTGKKLASFGRTLAHPIKTYKNRYIRKMQASASSESLKKSRKKTGKINDSSKTKKTRKSATAEAQRSLDPRINKISSIISKSQLVEQMRNDVGEILRGKSSAVVEVSEFIQDMNKNPDIIKVKSNAELVNLENMLDKELTDLNINPDTFDELTSKQYYETSKLNAYEEYIDNWKAKFFDSDTTEDLTEQEKDEIWSEIEETRTYDWFVENKIK